MPALSRLRIRSLLVLLASAALGGSVSGSDGVRPAPPTLAESLPVARLQPDPAIPTLQAAVGHTWAADITSHRHMGDYLDALTQAAPDRTRLESYGESYEGRPLLYLVITSAENMERLEEIRESLRQLADPRVTTAAEAESLTERLPAVVWLAASVHGNELSSTEAMLLTAYHLLADQRSETRDLLDRLIVVIDPLQNPDGRERFIRSFRENRGVFTPSNPLSTQHAERWPGGRFNHYLFDMNRDWFLQSQQETVARVKAYLDWQPQIYVDAHEMGRNNTYFFVPSADPVNPFVLPAQRDWLWKIGRHQADWFDRYGFAYTTREMFDSFYPGYGSEWPTLQGGLGILWEQAGTRGLVVDRDDETKLFYEQAVLHHYVSALATLEIAAQQRERLLQQFHAARARGVQWGNEGTVKQFFLPVGPRPQRTRRLATLLARNGVEVHVVADRVRVTGVDVRDGRTVERAVPPGSFQIPVAQPTGRLVRALLDQQVEMDEAYLRRQLERKADDLPDQIYDVTAWSLPLAFDVACLAADRTFALGPRWDPASPDTGRSVAPAQVAYLVRPTDGAVEAACYWLQQGVRLHVTNEGFTLRDRKYPRGTLIIPTRENGPELHELVVRGAARYAVRVVPTDTAFVDEGAHFGGPHVKWVRPPRILLAMDQPARYSVGHTWYLFDQQLRYPTTRVRCGDLPQVDLGDFNVLILPDGDYRGFTPFDKSWADRLRQWVQDGGTLILVAGGAIWAADENIGLVALRRAGKEGAAAASDGSPDSNPPAQSEKETAQRWPDRVPGAFLKAHAFQKHWLTFGCSATFPAFFHGDIAFEPLPPTTGRSLVEFAAEDELLVSGFCWPETKPLIAGKTYLAYQPLGKGHIVAFAADPNFRAMFPSLQRLFVNACLFGPGQ
jgi:hypothetical protein